MPVLKFRQAEYQALLRLDETIKGSILPLFIVPPVEYDFEEQRLKKSPLEHVEKLSPRLKGKWGDGEFLLDIDESLHAEYTPSGIYLIEHMYEEIKSKSLNPIPVFSLSYSDKYLQCIKSFLPENDNRVAFRVGFDELSDPSNYQVLLTTLQKLSIEHCNATLIIDFKDQADYSQKDTICNLLEMISGFWGMDLYFAIYIIGTSLDLSQVKKPGATLDREEWNLYEALCTSSFPLDVGYGDYLVETPYFLSIDMRKIKPAAKLIYSSFDCWHVIKGTAFRDNPSQMREICKELLSIEGVYIDKGYSKGDARISECANGEGTTGNLGTWKEVAISHHLTLVVNQLSSFYES